MTVSSAALSSLAASHDIISLGIAADEARRARHGTRTTFVRVADVDAAPGQRTLDPDRRGRDSHHRNASQRRLRPFSG